MAAGCALVVAGCLIASNTNVAIVQGPVIVAGFLLIATPLIAKTPGRLEASVPGRTIAWIGVISYTVLIVSEPLRSITHAMSVEALRDRWLEVWIVAGYLPLTMLLARPLAVVLGLVERTSPPLTVSDLVGAPEPHPVAQVTSDMR